MKVLINVLLTICLVVSYIVVGYVFEFKLSPDLALANMNGSDAGTYLAKDPGVILTTIKVAIALVYMSVMTFINRKFIKTLLVNKKF